MHMKVGSDLLAISQMTNLLNSHSRRWTFRFLGFLVFLGSFSVVLTGSSGGHDCMFSVICFLFVPT